MFALIVTKLAQSGGKDDETRAVRRPLRGARSPLPDAAAALTYCGGLLGGG
jgi:hypothetical protein